MGYIRGNSKKCDVQAYPCGVDAGKMITRNVETIESVKDDPTSRFGACFGLGV